MAIWCSLGSKLRPRPGDGTTESQAEASKEQPEGELRFQEKSQRYNETSTQDATPQECAVHVYSEVMLQNGLNTCQTLNLELDGKLETSHIPTNYIAMELINLRFFKLINTR